VLPLRDHFIARAWNYARCVITLPEANAIEVSA
jgi:hypothetical protein